MLQLLRSAAEEKPERPQHDIAAQDGINSAAEHYLARRHPRAEQRLDVAD